MKVLMINGSPNEHGCTDTALKIVSGALAEDGVESETVWLGNRARYEQRQKQESR